MSFSSRIQFFRQYNIFLFPWNVKCLHCAGQCPKRACVCHRRRDLESVQCFLKSLFPWGKTEPPSQKIFYLTEYRTIDLNWLHVLVLVLYCHLSSAAAVAPLTWSHCSWLAAGWVSCRVGRQWRSALGAASQLSRALTATWRCWLRRMMAASSSLYVLIGNILLEKYTFNS